MHHKIPSSLTVIAFLALEMPLSALAQPPPAKKQPSKAAVPAASRSVQPASPAAPAAPPSSKPEVLTNSSIMKMLAAGLDEEIVIAKINSSAASFKTDADALIRLKSSKVPPAVVRAMLNWKAPGAAPAAVTPPSVQNAAAAGTLVKNPGPAISVATLPEAPPLETVIARQGTNTFLLSDKPQAVMFVKSEASTAKEAVVNLVLGDVGIRLLTMGLQPMMGFNPYLGDTLNKVARVGKGLLLKQNGDTRGFEIETLAGSTAEVTLKEGAVEFLIPVNRFIPSAEMDANSIEPVVLRMQPRDNEQRRVLSGRKVVIKQTKKGRFDLKPTTDRLESDVEQSQVPVTVERMPGNIIRVTTNEDLSRGEYALVFRKKDPSSHYTANVPLKPTTPQADALTGISAGAPGIPGMSPEMSDQMTPEQIQMMKQMQQGQAQPTRGGMFGIGRRAPPPAPAATTAGPASTAGFLAWDFRILP